MNILHITKRYPPYVGGIEMACHDVCESIRDGSEDTNQLVLAFNDTPDTKDETYEGIHVIRAGVQKVVASQPLSKDYGKLMDHCFDTFHPDVIHFDFPNPYAAFYLLKAMKKHNFKGKFIVFWHCDIIKQKVIRKFFDHQTKKLIELADTIVITSPYYLKNTSFLPKYPNKHYEVLPSRVGDNRLIVTEEQKAKSIEIRNTYSGKKIGFFFGRHVPYKGLEYLIEADKFLDANKIQLLIGGSGPLTDELKEKAKDLKNIVWLGRLKEEDVNSYLLACDFFAFPSITRNEAYGISLAEALYFGKPAVTFTIPGSGVNWVNVDGETGLEAPNKDVKALADNIIELTEDKELYEKLSKGAYGRAQRYFTKERYAENVLRIFCGIEK